MFLDWSNPINWNCALNRGLVARWDVLPGNRSGSKLLNLVDVNRNAGTLTNMDLSTCWNQSPSPGGYGSLSFDGIDDCVVVLDNAGLRPTEVSVFAWFKTTRTGAQRLLTKPAVAGAQQGYSLAINVTAGKIEMRTRTTAVSSASATTVTDGKWYHVVGTFSNGVTKTYLNGRLDGTGSGTMTYDNNLDLQIGRFDSGAGQYFMGNIAEPGVINRALSAAEVQALYQDQLTGSRQSLNWIRQRTWFGVTAAGGTAVPVFYHQRQQQGQAA